MHTEHLNPKLHRYKFFRKFEGILTAVSALVDNRITAFFKASFRVKPELVRSIADESLTPRNL